MYQSDKLLKENREKLSPEQVSALEAVLGEAKMALDSDDEATMKAASEKLMQASMKVGEAMNQAGAGAGPAAGAAGGGSKKDGDVIDADFEEA